MSLCNMEQINSVKNCFQKTLDLVFCNFFGGIVSVCNNPLSIVDVYHPPLEISLRNTSPALLKSKYPVRFNFKRANYTTINAKISDRDWKQIFSEKRDVDAMVTELYRHLGDVVREHVPKSRRLSDKFPSWFSKPLIRVLNEKEKLRSRYKIYKNPRDYLEYRLLEGRYDE